MNFTSTAVFLGFIAAAYAIPVGVDSSADALTVRADSVESHDVRALSDDPTAALLLPRDESSSGDHPSTRGLKMFEATLDITYTDSGHRVNPPPTAAASLQKAKDLLRAAESKLDMGGEADRLKKIEALNEWKGSPEYVEFTFQIPICKGKCKATAYGKEKGQIHTQDGMELYKNGITLTWA